MMKILYISYSCNPFNGSEDQIGWNVPVECSKQGNDVFVITKSEHKENVYKFLSTHPDIKISFFYVDVPKIYRSVFKGIFYSLRIILWQKRAFKMANTICKQNEIEIIHQVAPVEFRAFGNYGKIKNTRFVIGPIGGGFPVPKQFKHYLKSHFFSEFLRHFFNRLSFASLRIGKRIKRCDYIYFTNEESLRVFEKHKLIENCNKSELLCDVGVDYGDINKSNTNVIQGRFVFFVPGRLYYRKGQVFLLDAIERMNCNKPFVVQIAGDGPLRKNLIKRINKSPYLCEHVELIGKIPFMEMKNAYEKCNAVILPSFSEATGTVLIESLSFNKPFIACNRFGARILDNQKASWLYDGDTRDEMINGLVHCMLECIENPCLLTKKTNETYNVAINYSWKNKVDRFLEKYKELLEK